MHFLFQKAVGIDKYLLNNAPYLHFELCALLLYNVHFVLHLVFFPRFLLKLLLFIYLIVLGLSCGPQDLQSLWHAISLVVASSSRTRD